MSLQSYNKYAHNTSNNKTDIVLFKLHGSIFWCKSEGDDEIFRTPHPSREDATVENVLLYPSQTKNTLIEPFKTNYDYLGECLANCKVCVVVGYSFRDINISEKIKSAIKMNKNLHWIVIDPVDSGVKVLSNLGNSVNVSHLKVTFKNDMKEHAGLKHSLSNYLFQVQ